LTTEPAPGSIETRFLESRPRRSEPRCGSDSSWSSVHSPVLHQRGDECFVKPRDRLCLFRRVGCTDVIADIALELVTILVPFVLTRRVRDKHAVLAKGPPLSERPTRRERRTSRRSGSRPTPRERRGLRNRWSLPRLPPWSTAFVVRRSAGHQRRGQGWLSHHAVTRVPERSEERSALDAGAAGARRKSAVDQEAGRMRTSDRP
jgi:hypothetical protein